MYLRNKISPPPGPPGCNPLRDEDRMPIVKAVSGDTWTISASLTAADGGPASPRNSYVEFVLAENQFSPPLWTGTWMDGILPDPNRPGLVHVNLPQVFTKTLRRGSYMFSLRVADKTKFSFDTQLEGYFLVEYMPTSDHRSIPYRDGTSEIFGGPGGSSGQDKPGKPDKPDSGDSSTFDGVLRLKDESTGLYYKVTAYKTEDGEVNLAICQTGTAKPR